MVGRKYLWIYNKIVGHGSNYLKVSAIIVFSLCWEVVDNSG